MARKPRENKLRVNFNDLINVEAGAVLRIHFKGSSTDGALSLIGMIRSGMLTSDNEARLSIIAVLRNWGDRSNQIVEAVTTETFDRTWFESQLADEITRLDVKPR